jgi:hypothetical protein
VSELKTSTEEILVQLVRPGVGARDYRLSLGATLADLLRVSGASVANQAVLVDCVRPEEAVSLHSGMVVTIVPRPKYADDDEPWRATVPAFVATRLTQTRRVGTVDHPGGPSH